MARACPALPIVVLPEDGVVRCRARLAPSVETTLLAAVDALTALHGELLSREGAAGSREATTETAVARVDRLAAETTADPMDTAALVPVVPNHDYFGVRTAKLDDARLAAETTAIVARALTDLRHARLGANDRAAEVLAMAALLRRLALGQGLAPRQGAAAEPRPRVTDARPAPQPAQDELTRWVVTHHLYFVLNLAAADAVSRAVPALAAGERDTAFEAVREAVVLVRGFTAAMMHAGDMSAPCYDAKVRPTMHPPAVPEALTGRTQPEHRAFRRAMRRLVHVSAVPFAEMAAADPELALARDALLEADLQDIERHIIVTAALVGDDRSLVQSGQAAESAVRVLRTMRHARAESYRDLMRFGDPVRLVEA
ncbi:hypothetical protein [Streptomyces sp. NBC_01190]|uniref:hypothetical protein n=1 Tax=Streptomyces sp. NBC_01190 TaxID=2903767 RepID=UPI003868260B|nr:hypothetical protein OG519_10980 [Streptomyces sp. NBC_01190]